jgi:hypothetical protein
MRRVLLLIGAAACLWLLLGIPARYLGGGDNALKYSGVAALLCTVPMAVSLVITTRLGRRNPRMLAIGVLAATGARMLVVLLGAVILSAADPFFEQPAFWAWLVIFYLATLALDVGLLLAGQPGKPAGQAGSRS